MPDLPKLSYVLLTHNREKYVRRAIESAFAQDYEGELEYIISDDCSTDRTFEIIRECVGEYKGGRRVVVTQTPRNMHLAGNTNHAVSFATSDWIIRADDDDIACIDRCSVIGRAIAEHPEATFVYTRQRDFTDDEEENVLRASRRKRTNVPICIVSDVRQGCSATQAFYLKDCCHQAWSSEGYRQFGPLPADAYYVDDVTCCWRANFLGYGLDIDTVTMYIRTGSNNMCRGGDDGSRGYRAILRQEKFNDKYQNITLAPLTTEFDRLCRTREQLPEEQASALESFFRELREELDYRRIMTTYWRKGIFNRIRINRKLGKNAPFDWARVMPMPLYVAALTFARILKKTGKK